MRNILILVMCSCEMLTALQNQDRYTFCEACITTAQELERVLKETAGERRRGVAGRLLRGAVCETTAFQTHGHLDADTLRASCQHLIEVHHVEFRRALEGTAAERLAVALCYEHSTACVGVKRPSLQSQNKVPFKDSDIDALLRDNQASVRIAHPVHPAASTHYKDEL